MAHYEKYRTLRRSYGKGKSNYHVAAFRNERFEWEELPIRYETATEARENAKLAYENAVKDAAK